MSKELKIQGALSKDFQQIYIDDEPTGLFINNEGKIKTSNIFSNNIDDSIKVGDNKYLTLSDNKIDVSSGNLSLDVSGDITLDADGGNVYIKDLALDIAEFSNKGLFIEESGSVSIKEKSSANADITAYGQVWIKDEAPNELSFTDDAGTDIIGIGKYHFETKVTNFYATATANYLPLAGYVLESTGTLGKNEFIAMVAPYNGTLERAVFRSEIAQNGDLIFAIHESADGTEVPALGAVGSKTTAINIADDTSQIVDFDSMTSGSNVITKGRIYAIKLTTPSGPQDTNVTLVFKWDTTS